MPDPRERFKSPPPRLVADIEETLDALRRQLGPGFNPMQARGLANWMRTNQHVPFRQHELQQQLIRGGGGDLTEPTATVARLIEGRTLELRPAPWIWVLADGRVVADPAGRDPVTGLRPTPAPAGSATAMTRPLVRVVMADAILGALLALFLCGCGVL